MAYWNRLSSYNLKCWLSCTGNTFLIIAMYSTSTWVWVSNHSYHSVNTWFPFHDTSVCFIWTRLNIHFYSYHSASIVPLRTRCQNEYWRQVSSRCNLGSPALMHETRLEESTKNEITPLWWKFDETEFAKRVWLKPQTCVFLFTSLPHFTLSALSYFILLTPTTFYMNHMCPTLIGIFHIILRFADRHWNFLNQIDEFIVLSPYSVIWNSGF